jgi:hypothetical protein
MKCGSCTTFRMHRAEGSRSEASTANGPWLTVAQELKYESPPNDNRCDPNGVSVNTVRIHIAPIHRRQQDHVSAGYSDGGSG